MTKISEVKAIHGTPDTAFVDKHFRFGVGSVAREHPIREFKEALTLNQRAAMQEWVYGNSRSLPGWEGPLDAFVSADPITAGLFIFQDIVVGPHATFNVTGDGLLCNTLSVHYTGKVRILGPGPVKVEMNHYVRYGFLTEVGSISGPWNNAV